MLERVHFEVGETAVTIISEPEYHGIAKESIFETRDIIQRQIGLDPLFRDTLEPYLPAGSIHPILKRMCEASAMAGVGPMATVAGAVADMAVRSMRDAGARNAIVDNGGDIALLIEVPVDVGIYSGEFTSGIGFRCEPREGIFGICTSSRTVGPSISFGRADSVTVISENVLLADACATRLGNDMVSHREEDLKGAIEQVCDIEGVEGAFVVMGEKVAMKGRLPHLIRTTESTGRITTREF